MSDQVKIRQDDLFGDESFGSSKKRNRPCRNKNTQTATFAPASPPPRREDKKIWFNGDTDGDGKGDAWCVGTQRFKDDGSSTIIHMECRPYPERTRAIV